MEAFAQAHRGVSHFRLLIVGDGPERASLETDVRARGLSRDVTFTGAVAPEAVPGLLASVDAAVAPYPAIARFYFSPLKVYEYMAAGRAIVASRIGQLEELLEDGDHALLCPPGDAAALAEVLLRLEGDPALCERLGQAARRSSSAIIRGKAWPAVSWR